jgi:hypothetical protein
MHSSETYYSGCVIDIASNSNFECGQVVVQVEPAVRREIAGMYKSGSCSHCIALWSFVELCVA